MTTSYFITVDLDTIVRRMPKVKQLDWSKLKPNTGTRFIPKLRVTKKVKRQQKWAREEQAQKYVDMLFLDKITEMMDLDA